MVYGILIPIFLNQKSSDLSCSAIVAGSAGHLEAFPSVSVQLDLRPALGIAGQLDPVGFGEGDHQKDAGLIPLRIH